MNELLTPVLARVLRGETLTDGEIGAAMAEILEGRVTDIQAAGFIVALRAKGETVEELAALVRAIRAYDVLVDVAPGAIDTCGTGGDGACTVNVSTMAALVAAGAGARVVKHGNRAASSQCGSADVLEALGVTIELEPADVARCVEIAGVGFCFAPKYHPAYRFLGPARRELGVPTTFNFLGPLLNPGQVTRQSIGVSDEAMAARMLATLRALGAEHALVFHGDDGLDELTTTTTNTVHELVRGEVKTYRVDAVDFGLERVDAEALRGGSAEENANAMRAVLAAEKGAHRDITLLNAAAALVVAGIADDLGAGIEAAAAAIDSGAAERALAAMVATSTSAGN